MLKIGDFSKLGQVSVKALRHYGRLGLLKPAWIDRFTGYRYYTPDQLPRLNRILALKDLGFSLEQIRQLLRSDLPVAELRGMMRMKHAELEQELQVEQARLARIEARLHQIEKEGMMPPHEVVLKQVPSQRVIGIREVIPGFHRLPDLFRDLDSCLEAQRLTLDLGTPRLAIYYDAEYRDRGIDVEVAAPIPRFQLDSQRARVHELDGAGTMACVVHQGSYEELTEAYKSVMRWTEINGYQIVGPNREIYLQGPWTRSDPMEPVTEVQFPVKKKPVSSYAIQFKEKATMEPKIVTKAAFTAVGMLYYGKNQNNEIARMWEEFNPRMHEIAYVKPGSAAYGVCGNTEDEGFFNYLAGLEVESAADIPEGMVSWDVLEQTYAVFPCTLKTIGETYHHAYQVWLPQSGFQLADGPDFEFYDEEFDPEDKDPKLTIYIPIKQ